MNIQWCHGNEDIKYERFFIPQLPSSEQSQSEQRRQNQESLVATSVAGDFLRARRAFFTDWASISKVILSCFSTWIENKTMTTAPSAPATVTPPWLAWLSQKACPRGKPRQVRLPRDPCSPSAASKCAHAGGLHCAMAETLPHRGKGQPASPGLCKHRGKTQASSTHWFLGLESSKHLRSHQISGLQEDSSSPQQSPSYQMPVLASVRLC